MKCMVLIPCGEAPPPIPHSPDERARRSRRDERAVIAELGGYLAHEADDLKSAIRLAARIRTAGVGPLGGAAFRSGANRIPTKDAPPAIGTQHVHEAGNVR
jgi:hypothetical protein